VELLPVKLVAALGRARHLVILTGPGVSAESGVPTLRDASTGLWARFLPEELASPEAFERDPALVWQWYQWRRSVIASARPNPAHVAIAALERLLERVTLITQNVDGLHQQAGSRSVIEFHGNIHRNRCSVEQVIVDIETAGTTKPPKCPNCGARVRPDVVWFGETIPRSALDSATYAASDCDVYLAAGTSALVHPAASLAAEAQAAGAVLIEINSQETAFSEQADYHVRQPAGIALPALLTAIN